MNVMTEYDIAVMLEQMKVCLPNYANIFKQIKGIRREAKQFNNYYKERYEHFPYKNVISIIGERGSGKSTLFNRIRTFLKVTPEDAISSYLQKEQEHVSSEDKYILEQIQQARSKVDINLEIIVPEMLEHSSDILGVILINIMHYIEQNKAQITQYYCDQRHEQDGFYEKCIYDKKNPLEECWTTVFKTYLQREKEYSHVITENYSSLSDYIKEKERNLASEIELGKQIFKLFSEISKVFSNKNGQALIYVYMDDVDISRERCRESINTILRYLKHPSVVVFVSGDLKRFENGLLMDEMLQQESFKLRHFFNEGEIVKRDEEYIYEFMKKVMPYSNRYYLIKLDNKGKMQFKYEQIQTAATQHSQERFNFSQIISQRLLHKQEEPLPEWSYIIFDEKPRGIISVWEFIENYFPMHFENENQTSLKAEMKINKSTYRDLIHIIIDTNLVLKNKENYLNDEIIRLSEDEEGKIILSVNYDKLLNDIYRQENLKVFEQKNYIVILHLLYFLERIINHQKVINSKYSAILNAIISDASTPIYPNINDANMVLELYNRVSEKFSIETQPLIYTREEYFSSYATLVQEKEYHIDLNWHRNFEETKALYATKKGKIRQDMAEIFKDFEYNQQILFEEDEENGYGK